MFFTMIQIQACQDNFHPGKLDLGLLVWTDKLKGILKLYTVSGCLWFFAPKFREVTGTYE